MSPGRQPTDDALAPQHAPRRARRTRAARGNTVAAVTPWPALEAAVTGRVGWRRVGREWHGPCPVTGSGRDTCWLAAGGVGGVLAGCRKCGGRLDGLTFRAHLDALMGRTAGTPPPHTPNSSPALPSSPSPRPGAVWGATAAPEGTALTSERRIPAMKSNPAITPSTRPRSAATADDSVPRPERRGCEHGGEIGGGEGRGLPPAQGGFGTALPPSGGDLPLLVDGAFARRRRGPARASDASRCSSHSRRAGPSSAAGSHCPAVDDEADGRGAPGRPWRACWPV